MEKNGKVYVDDQENWLNFRNAIVIQAVEDYKDSLKGIMIFHGRDPKYVINELENFFKSENYSGLVQGRIDGIATIRASRDTACEEMKNSIKLWKKQIHKKKKKLEKVEIDQLADDKLIEKLNNDIWWLETRIMDYYRQLIKVQEMPEP